MLGGTTITADAPIDKIPLLVKAGSILPLGPTIQYTAEKAADPIELRIYPGAERYGTSSMSSMYTSTG